MTHDCFYPVNQWDHCFLVLSVPFRCCRLCSLFSLRIAILKEKFEKLGVWFRYADDTFALFGKRKSASQFTISQQARKNNIKFTIEFEESGKIPFLNILVKRCPYNALMTFFYRKKTLTSLYTKWTHSRLANISSISFASSLIVASEFALTSLPSICSQRFAKTCPSKWPPSRNNNLCNYSFS